MIKNIVIGVLSVLVLVLLFSGSVNLGANTAEYNVKQFLNTVTFSGTTAFTGTETHSGTNTISGVTTFTANPIIDKTTSSTLQIGGTVAGGTNPGCIQIGIPGTTTTVWMVATSTANTVITSTTKPSACK